MKKYTLSFFIIIATLLVACDSSKIKSSLDIQGHRGCRGLYPENTINGFIKAYDLGVNTLEMDVVISKDSQVIISHEAISSHQSGDFTVILTIIVLFLISHQEPHLKSVSMRFLISHQEPHLKSFSNLI